MSSTGEARVREASLPPLSVSRPPATGATGGGIMSLDLRSLALFRVAFGIVVLCELVSLLPEIDAFYTDRGIFPREAMIGRFGHPWNISIHLMSGLWGIQLGLFLIAIAAACAMIAGYRTRLTTFVLWLLVCSMEMRNTMITHGGDTVIRVLLFWSMFAPLNGRWSLDRALNPRSPPLEVANSSWGTQALMFQLCFIYWFTAGWKMHPTWTTAGSAVYYTLNLDYFVQPLGKFLLGFPTLLPWMTRSTILLELCGPFLVFSPVWTGRLRLLAVLAFIGFHTTIGLCLALGTFSWVCSAAWLMFLPPLVWEKVEAWSAARSRNLVIFYDRNCQYCRNMVLALREALLLTPAKIQRAQDDPIAESVMLRRNSWVVRDPEGGIHWGYDALLTLFRRSSVTRWVVAPLSSTPARLIGERAYRWASSRRARLSELLRVMTPPPPRGHLGPIGGAIVLVCALIVFAGNFAGLPWVKLRLPWPLTRVASLASVGQRWDMFAPYPQTRDGWFQMVGVSSNGRRFDVWNGGSPIETKPADVAATMRDSRWRKYLESIRNQNYSLHWPYFGRYVCRVWNESHRASEQVREIYFNYFREPTPPPGQPTPKPEKVTLWKQDCSGNTSSE